MKQEKFSKEMMNIGLLFVILIVVFKIIFYKEIFLNTIRVTFALFWMLLPGFFVMYYWHEQLDFLERFFIGIAASAAFVGIFSYYLGLIGVNVKYSTIFLPVILLGIGFFINRKFIFKQKSSQNQNHKDNPNGSSN